MKQRSVLGWTLVGAFAASVSCGGGNSFSGPKGFGLPCMADKDCSANQLLCGPDSKCVQCLSETDCKPADSCSAGLCKTPTPCKDSRDCSGDQVCQTTYGLCVDCITSKDCTTGQVCRQNKCGDQSACDFTSDCTDGLLCDVPQHLCVTCRNDTDCGLKQLCTDNECVSETSKGGSGSGGTTSTGGKSSGGSGGKVTAGTDAGGTEVGGSDVGGTNGGGFGGVSGSGGAGGTSAGSAGKAGSGGNSGSGGASGCDCLGGEVCTPDQRCVPPTLIDDLVDCDDQILTIQGRKGPWAAAADIGINIMHGFNDPGSGWVNHTCAAWAAGGELVKNGPNTTFAFIGFKLNQGLAYSLAAYSGLQIKLESGSSVQVVMRTVGDGYFQFTLAPIVNSNVRTAPFASLAKMNNSLEAVYNPANTSEIQFSVVDPKSFGLAVHKVSLY